MGVLYVLFQRAHRAAIEARRRASTAGYLGWSVLASLTLAIALSIVIAFAAQLWLLGLWMIAVVLIGVCVVPVLGPWLLRHLLVPAGQVKLAFHCGRFSTVSGTDPEAFGLAAAAWAVVGAKRPVSGDARAWLQDKIAKRGVLGDAEVVSTAFLIARDDAEAARRLLESVAELAELHPAVRELAGEWLAVEAVERGAWDEILPWGFPATPLRFLLEGIAAVRRGEAGAPGPMALRARWVMAPYRKHTRALLAQAVEQPSTTTITTSEAAAANNGSEAATAGAVNARNGHSSVASLDEAIALHVRAMGGTDAKPDAADVHLLATSWDRAFEAPELLAWMETRAGELGATPGAAQRAAGEIMETVARELRATIEQHRLPSPPALRSRFGSLLGNKLRHGRLDELELQFTRWADRVTGGSRLPPIDEWREFLAVRQSYRDVVASGGEELRRLAFPHVFNAANRAAVVLWNERDELSIAHAILAWELAESNAVGDSAAIELAAKNAKLKFTTRTGPHNE